MVEGLGVAQCGKICLERLQKRLGFVIDVFRFSGHAVPHAGSGAHGG